jgi:hypothetical protein
VLSVSRRDSLFPVTDYAGENGMTWGVMPDGKTFLVLKDRTAATYSVLALNWPRLFER